MRRKSDHPTGRRKSDRPAALERAHFEKMRDSSLARLQEEGIIKLPPQSLGIETVRSRSIGLAVQEFVQNQFIRSAIVRPRMIRMMAGESAVTFPTAIRAFQEYMAGPRETIVHLKEGHERFKGYLRITNKGPGAAPEMLPNVPPLLIAEADPLMRMAIDLDRVCHVKGRKIHWVKRSDPRGEVHVGTISEGVQEPVLIIPFSEELGLITVRGQNLDFGDVFSRIQNAVLLASDMSHLASMNLISRMDPLTGAFNRRAFEKLMEYAIHQFIEKGDPTSLVMCDIDHFKRVNDTYGHDMGDKVLSSFAVTAATTLRTLDRIGILKPENGLREQELGRVGGEEFGIVLDKTNLKGAIVAAERCRKAVEESVLMYGNEEISVTISIGIASIPEVMFAMEHFIQNGDMNMGSLERIRKVLKNAADDALYAAKENGRNMVVVGHLDNRQQWRTSQVTIRDNGELDYRRVYRKENGKR